MNQPVATYKFSDGGRLEIHHDEDPESPREWDNLGTMICLHKRYNLGDKHDLNESYFSDWREVRKYIEEELDAAVILPLILYDHSGLSISTSREYPFNCPWDSGQVGFIHVSNGDVVREYGSNSETNLEIARKVLEQEVETYDQYLRGDIYSFLLYAPPCDQCGAQEEILDSCCGFYGHDPKENGMMDYLNDERREELKTLEPE